MFCTWEKNLKKKNPAIFVVCVQFVRVCVNVQVFVRLYLNVCHMHGAKPAVLSIYCEVFTV